MEQMERNNQFLKREYRKTLFPIMFSILGGTVTSIIDTILVSFCLGKEGLAVVNLCMPVFLCFCAVGVIASAGSSILSAREEGKEVRRDSETYYFSGVSCGLLAGVVIMVAGCILCSPIASLLAENSALTQSVREYSLVLFLGAVPYILAYLPLDYLQLEGNGRAILGMMILTIAVDTVLDVIFLFVVPFGYYGAAAASVLSMLVSAVYGIFALQKTNPKYQITLRKLSLRDGKAILIAGSPSAAASLWDALKMVILNLLILSAGGTDALAIWAVITVLSELSRIVTSGVPQTAAPMLGVLFSSHENVAIRLLMKIELKTGVLALSVYGVLLLVLQGWIGEIYQIGNSSLLVPFLCMGASFYLELLAGIWTTEFYAIAEVKMANLLSFFRAFLFPVLCAWGIKEINGAIWIFLPISGICTVVTMSVIASRAAGKKSHGEHCYSKILLLDDYLSKTGKLLEFSIKMSPDEICGASEQIGTFCSKNQMADKMANRLGIAIEEYLMIIREKNDKIQSVDLRVTNIDGITMIRVRSSGERYNPFETESGEIGIEMVRTMASKIQFSYVLGVNNIDIIFQTEEKGN